MAPLRSFYPLSPGARGELSDAWAEIEPLLATDDPSNNELLQVRLERHFHSLRGGLEAVYGEAATDTLRALCRIMARRFSERGAQLKRLDLERLTWPSWLQHETQLGYVCYPELFAGDLSGVAERLDYLEELGVTYLHLMPFLRARAGDSDGGYAVADFREIESGLGTIEDLEALTAELRRRNIALCCDLVLNHVADEHPWAQAARKGDPRYQDYFWIFPDRTLPDRYEETLWEVFPATDPGSFTEIEDLGWVWTSFHTFQWDLNWQNPQVFLEMADIILELANRGIDVFRLDAIAFLWKRLGTDCQNQPEVHAITRALRAMARIVAPAVTFLAEAIVGPQNLMAYLGTGKNHGLVSDLAYHNSLMAHLWSSLAARDARLATHALARFPQKPAGTAWLTYVRCHDDIGWAIADEAADAVGWSGPAHRAFLADFYAGRFEGSFARGADFQVNPLTGDTRTSGSCASMCGLEAALAAGDPASIDLAIRRILVVHAIIFAWDGIPLLYMGDELGLLNDYGYREDPERAGDSRWMHRPAMPWERIAHRHDIDRVAGRIWAALRRLIRARKGTRHLHAGAPLDVIPSGNPRVLALVRRHAVGNLLGLFNLSEGSREIPRALLAEHGIDAPIDRIGGGLPLMAADQLLLEPYDALWLVAAEQ